MTASLVRLFGLHNLALAEDVIQDAFCRALETWPRRGIPPNPSAWLMTTARNRALDVIRRERTARTFAPEVTRLLETEWTATAVVDEAFTAPVIRDEQLRMMFSCCLPELAEPVQIALVLTLLCGFGAPEIAAAFLTGRAAIEKRIARGKKVLAASRKMFDLRDADFAPRLSAVQRALYLLFNEGYHGASSRGAVRIELCDEAMRLAAMLRDDPTTATPATLALSALMALHAARLPARLDEAGDLTALWDQDRSLWDQRLIAAGRALLEQSASGDDLSSYHVEAAIALEHAIAPCMDATNWDAIVTLYERLMAIAPSPVVMLNRGVAIAQRDGPAAGIAALASLQGDERLAAYPFYPAALGELERRRGNAREAMRHLQHALVLARNASEGKFLQKRMADLEPAQSAHRRSEWPDT